MAKLIDKDALVAEIERRIEYNTEWKDACKTLAVLAANQAIEEDKKILSIINAFEVKEINFERNGKDCKEEPVSDDFEEACNQMSKAAIISKCEAGKPFFSDGDYKLGFKAGAKWQKQKDNDAKGKKMMR